MARADTPPPRATMLDVARLAGVGLKTVSRVVNGEPGVADATRIKVLRTAEQLSYRHNFAASNLRRAGTRTGMIGAVVQDIDNRFSAYLLRGLEDAARRRGASMLTSFLDEDPDRERAQVKALIGHRVDALVLMPATPNHEYLLSEMRAGLPIVFVDRLPHGIDVDSVTVDNRAGARQAVRHLLKHGHRRIALIGDLPQIETARLRREGYEQALAEAGVDLDASLLLVGNRTEADAAGVVRELMATVDPPSAIFTTSNRISAGALDALHRLDLVGRVAIVGFDDFPLADLIDPPLTVIQQDIEALSSEVVTRLFARLDGDASLPEKVVLPVRLVERGSGEIPFTP
ncbi:MAG: LacI family DNA-binding transcriptional regulator [Ornithinimicrobium sp.]